MTTPATGPKADTEDVGDSVLGQGSAPGADVTESLIEEVSIDGMCGVY